MEEITVLGIKILYDKGNVRIVDSLKLNKEWQMKVVLDVFTYMTDYKSKRSKKSWINEWKAHNRMYKLHLFRKHTVECDLEENESKFRLLIYKILGGLI